MFIGFAIASLGTAHSAELFKRLKVKQKAISQIIALIMSGLVGIVMAYNGLAYWGIAAQNVVYVTMVNLCYWLFHRGVQHLILISVQLKKCLDLVARY